jgi:hypothetical protein
MKNFIYVYKILFLEVHFPIIIDEEKQIIPCKSNIIDGKSDFNTNYTNISFNPNLYSFIVIQKDSETSELILKQEIENILVIFSMLLLEQFFYYDRYYFEMQSENIILKEATTTTLKEARSKGRKGYLHGPLGVYSFEKIAKELFSKIKSNPISDSLFFLIAEFLTNLNTNIIEVNGILSWNTLEHIASRYWKKVDQAKLYKIRPDIFNKFIEYLKSETENFVKDLKPEHILIDDPNYSIKSLLKGGLSKSIIEFSPIKYKIYCMFQNENITDSEDKQIIKKIYSIRNKLIHNGLSIDELRDDEELQKKLKGENLLEVLIKFTPYLYRKLLKFLGIIEEFAYFYLGRLRLKIVDKLSAEPLNDIDAFFEREVEEIIIAEKIEETYDIIRNIVGKEFIAELYIKDEKEDSKICINNNPKKDFFNLVCYEPSSRLYKYTKNLTKKGINNPEDIYNLIDPIEFKLLLENNQIVFKVIPRCIDGQFAIRWDNLNKLIKKFGKTKIERDYFTFEIEEIKIELK